MAGCWEALADPAGLAALQTAAESWLADADVAPETARRVLLALDELAANLMLHAALPDGSPRPFTARLARQAENIELVLVDGGPPFDPRAQAAPAAPTTLTEVPIGGLGLVLVRKLASHIDYLRTADGNRVLLQFSEGAQDPPSG